MIDYGIGPAFWIMRMIAALAVDQPIKKELTKCTLYGVRAVSRTMGYDMILKKKIVLEDRYKECKELHLKEVE
jgi:hypothetical protein